MKQALPHLALTPALSIPASERSIADLMDSFEVLLGTYQEAAGAGDENARNVARKALKDAHLSVLTELFVTHRSRHARTATNRAAGIDPAGPQPVGYVSPGELDRLDADDQAFIDPPSCVAPKSIPLFAERPLSAAILADEMQDIAMTYANGWATDFHTEAARILKNQPRPATTAARAAASAPACPFCAGTSITTHLDDSQGTKWGFAACGECSARGPEVRTGYDRSEHAPWREQALAEWANRAVAMMPTARALAQLYEGLEAVLVSYTLSHWRADADLSLPLVEHSGADGSMDLSAGREEIRHVVDAIYSDVRTPPHQLNSEAWLAVGLVRQRIADALHYPAIWDTAAYPSLESAAREAICNVGRGGPTCNRSGHAQD